MIHPSVVMYGAEHIEIGKDVRIDAFCVLTAGPRGLVIGDHVHISPGVYIFGTAGRVELRPFSNLSSRVSVFTATDELFSGAMTGACIPEKYRNLQKGDVIFEEHAAVCAGAVILPGVTLHRGSVVGALSLVKRSVPAYHIVVGTNQRKIGERDAKRLAELEGEFLCAYRSTVSAGTEQP
jgi:acetyltransferase-like isoleucine patch superfamily enzyme